MRLALILYTSGLPYHIDGGGFGGSLGYFFSSLLACLSELEVSQLGYSLILNCWSNVNAVNFCSSGC